MGHKPGAAPDTQNLRHLPMKEAHAATRHDGTKHSCASDNLILMSEGRSAKWQ